ETREEKLAAALMAELKPLLKHQLTEAYQAILQIPRKPAMDWQEARIRKATGDTQKLLFATPDRVN
ncbi:MAG TPA: hypothetical protein VEU54_00635, partial [Steroidobacteraceae bacterium]|nr:hypothetical protein [Steroidobacteraceae bacterium]